jgi:hypothetical protein
LFSFGRLFTFLNKLHKLPEWTEISCFTFYKIASLATFWAISLSKKIWSHCGRQQKEA